MTETATRERLGRRVREVWIAWAREQPHPKPSWLAPWEELSEPEREVDRRIGAALAAERDDALRFEEERQALFEAQLGIDTCGACTSKMDAVKGGATHPDACPVCRGTGVTTANERRLRCELLDAATRRSTDMYDMLRRAIELEHAAGVAVAELSRLARRGL